MLERFIVCKLNSAISQKQSIHILLQLWAPLRISVWYKYMNNKIDVFPFIFDFRRG